MTWLDGPLPARFDVPELGVAFVPLTPSLLDADYAAVMHDIPMLRAWSGQDWPTAAFTRDDDLVDVVRHDQEQRAGVALTYSVLADDQVRGCIYAHRFEAALATRDVEPPAPPPVPSTAAVVRGWAHDLAPRALIASARQLLLAVGADRVWWQVNRAGTGQLAACDELGWTEALVFTGRTAIWELRSEQHRS